MNDVYFGCGSINNRLQITDSPYISENREIAPVDSALVLSAIFAGNWCRISRLDFRC